MTDCEGCKRKNADIDHLLRRLEQKPIDFSRQVHTRQVMREKERRVKAEMERDHLRRELGEIRAAHAMLKKLIKHHLGDVGEFERPAA